MSEMSFVFLCAVTHGRVRVVIVCLSWCVRGCLGAAAEVAVVFLCVRGVIVRSAGGAGVVIVFLSSVAGVAIVLL